MSLIFLVAACGETEKVVSVSEKVMTVSDYLHDMDAAKAAKAKYSNNPGKYEGNPDWANASAAIGKVQFMNGCWKHPRAKFGDGITTANTDHACLDAAGYIRSK